MKTKLKWVVTLLLALVVQISFAQEKTVSGTVSDSSGSLPGVSVLVKGTKTGTETDFNGKYTIKAKTGDIQLRADSHRLQGACSWHSLARIHARAFQLLGRGGEHRHAAQG